MKTALICVAAACAVALVGCGPQAAQGEMAMVIKPRTNEAGLVGKWKGVVDIPKAKKDDPSAQMASAFAKAMMSSISLDLKLDKSFTLTMFFPIEGKWSVSGDKVTLVAEKFMGMNKAEMKKMGGVKGNGSVKFSDKPLELRVSSDGKTLSMLSANPKEGKLDFKRDA